VCVCVVADVTATKITKALIALVHSSVLLA